MGFPQTYGYQWEYTLGAGTTNGVKGHHVDVHWARGAGGTCTELTWVADPDGTVLSSNLTVTVWPPDNGYLPSLTAQGVTTEYSYGLPPVTYTLPENVVPNVEWMEQSTSAGNRPDL